MLTSPFSSSRHVYPFLYLSFNNVFYKAVRKMWQIQLAVLLFIVSRIFLSPLTVCDIYSFLKSSVQLIFSILLQHHISNIPDIF